MINMARRLMLATTLFLFLVAFSVSTFAQQSASEGMRIRGRVVDVNGAPVGGARLYYWISFVWDSSRNSLLRAPDDRIETQTDSNGFFLFDLSKRARSAFFLVGDEPLTRIGYLKVSTYRPKEIYTIRLTRAAHIKAVLESEEPGLENLTVQIGLRYPDERGILGYAITARYGLRTSTTSLPIDLVCPAGLDLVLELTAQRLLQPIRNNISALAPGEIMNLGRIEFQPVSGYELVGHVAPAFEIEEWIKGKPITLDKLRGKVVLLDFWGLWCGPCLQMFGQLVDLHSKYARDGLVIIGIHDSSEYKEALRDPKEKRFDLSRIPFRIAVDSAPAGVSSGGRMQGKTIADYNVSAFSGLVLINRDGEVESFGQKDLEKRINHLLYGKISSKYGRDPSIIEELSSKHSGLLLRALVCAGLILLCGVYVIVRLSKKALSDSPPA